MVGIDQNPEEKHIVQDGSFLCFSLKSTYVSGTCLGHANLELELREL